VDTTLFVCKVKIYLFIVDLEQTMINRKTIIYGWSDNTNIRMLLEEKDTILIEPRKHILDSLPPIAGTLIKKAIYNKAIETTMHVDVAHTYHFHVAPNDEVRRERVFTTSIYDLFVTHKIVHVGEFIFNIDIGNIDQVLGELSLFNHIVSKVSFVRACEHPFLHNFIGPSEEDSEFVTYTHKNVNVPLPKICMCDFGETLNYNETARSYFTQQYLIRELKVPTKITKNNHFHDCVKQVLETFFDSPLKESDIVVINNNSFFSSKRLMYPILYPLQTDVIYMIKEFDILYGTRSTMFLLYELVSSKEFADFLSLQTNRRPILRYTSKRMFYDYIEKVFRVHNVTYF